MSLERVATFDALVSRASDLLLQAEQEGRSDASAEAVLILEYLRRQSAVPLSQEELIELTDGPQDEQRAVRVLLDALRLKQMVRSLTQDAGWSMAAE